MRLIISTLATMAIIFSGLTLGSVASAVELNVVGPNSVTVSPGDQVTLDLTIRNPASEGIFGIGASVHGYDESVADFNSGQAVFRFLSNVCVAPHVCLIGLENVVAGALQESAIGANGNRVQIALAAQLVPHNESGLYDQGLDGVEGTPQFSLIFDAIAPGVTTFFIDTMYQGDGVVLAGGVLEQATGSTFTINVVPEPGTALLMGLGLIGLASSMKPSREE